MLTLHLAPIFNARGINKPFTFLRKAGVNAHSATKLLHSDLKDVSLAHIELLCKLLVCEPNDLFKWAPNNGDALQANHPLYKLVENDAAGNLQQTLAAIPYKELNEAAKNIVAKS